MSKHVDPNGRPARPSPEKITTHTAGGRLEGPTCASTITREEKPTEGLTSWAALTVLSWRMKPRVGLEEDGLEKF
jgi:hypothetical protein